jgi:hypothetical protein
LQARGAAVLRWVGQPQVVDGADVGDAVAVENDDTGRKLPFSVASVAVFVLVSFISGHSTGRLSIVIHFSLSIPLTDNYLVENHHRFPRCLVCFQFSLELVQPGPSRLDWSKDRILNQSFVWISRAALHLSNSASPPLAFNRRFAAKTKYVLYSGARIRKGELANTEVFIIPGDSEYLQLILIK